MTHTSRLRVGKIRSEGKRDQGLGDRGESNSLSFLDRQLPSTFQQRGEQHW